MDETHHQPPHQAPNFAQPLTPPPAPQPEKPKGKLKLPLIIIAILVLALAGFGVYHFVQNRNSDTGSLSVKDVTEYPSQFKQADIPEYPDGEVTSGQEGSASVDEGISVIVSTPDDLSKVAKFYEEQLTKRGWKATNTSVTVDTTSSVYYQVYAKGNVEVSVTATTGEDSKTTNISLSYKKK